MLNTNPNYQHVSQQFAKTKNRNGEQFVREGKVQGEDMNKHQLSYVSLVSLQDNNKNRIKQYQSITRGQDSNRNTLKSDHNHSRSVHNTGTNARAQDYNRNPDFVNTANPNVRSQSNPSRFTLEDSNRNTIRVNPSNPGNCNRADRSRDRKKKLEREAQLEVKVQELKDRNIELTTLADVLKSQLSDLKQHVMDPLI